MSEVSETTLPESDQIEEEVFSYLRNTAQESVFYVALGKCLKHYIAEKYCLSENQVCRLVSKVTINLVDKIRKLTK